VWDDGRAGVIDLTGLNAVVTGGNGGIGPGMATGMAKAGANIAIWARDAAKSAEAVAGLEKLGVRALALTCREAARRFADQGTGGSLVLVSSMISRFGGAGQSAYAASKTGVLGFEPNARRRAGPAPGAGQRPDPGVDGDRARAGGLRTPSASVPVSLRSARSPPTRRSSPRSHADRGDPIRRRRRLDSATRVPIVFSGAPMR
jgi:hypothetical protein